MLSEDSIKALAEPMVYRLEKLNGTVLESIGKQIKEIGKVKASDIEKLRKLKEYGADVNRIMTELERITDLNKKDLEKMFVAIASYDEDAMADLAKIKEKAFIPFAKNKKMQQFVASIAKQTADTYINLSQNTGFMIFKGKDKVFTSMSETYSEIIDRAVLAVTTGSEDYYTTMRKSMRDLADSGLRIKYTPLTGRAGEVVDYASGYSRRLDTAVRQNILWGAKQCYQGIMDNVGSSFGADGYEIDYHPNPRPSHAEMGGKMYAIGRGKRVNGIYYPSISTVQHLLDDYNCLHTKTPVILGVSVPTFDEDELKRLKAKDKETIEYEGKKYTGYEATQMQRKLETAMRHAKDRQKIAAAAGDDILRREEQAKLNVLSHKYKDFSDVAGLPTKAERAAVSGYHRVKTLDELKNSQKNSIIKIKEYGNMNILPNADKVYIPIEKFTQYALNPNKDFNKATAFQKALGYNIDNADKLIHNIYVNVKYFEAKKKTDNGYGERYSVLMSLIGENGKTANVQTAWIIDKETKKPRLLSAYVTNKKF
ncbi:MAG: hypothetical protein IIW54_06700 [Lachnospiraceae bacterium]|nr:hypothetical protein [Lachnospiraceae bacterium]